MLKEKTIGILDSWVLYSLYLLIFFIPISKAAIEITFFSAFFAFTLKKILKPDFVFLKSKQTFFLLLFFAFSASSLINSGPYFGVSLKALFLKWFEYVCIFLMVRDVLGTPKRVERGIKVFLCSAALIGIDALYQKSIGLDMFWMRPLVDVGRGLYGITATFQHYNSLGAFLAMALCMVLILILHSKEARQTWYLSILGIVLSVCLFLTFSRGSWVSFLIALLLILLMSRHYVLSFVLIAVFIAVLLLIPETRARLLFIFEVEADQGRYRMWKGAWAMIKENPFLGKGLGTFMQHFPNYGNFPTDTYAHNSYLQIWAESGLLSLLSFLGFLGILLVQAVIAFFRKYDALLLGLLGGIFGFLFHSFFDNHFYSLQLSALFWSMAGLLSAMIRINRMSKL